MPLTSQQQQLIVNVDSRVKMLLANGGNEAILLMDMLAVVPDIKTIMYASAEKEMDLYVQEYDGFIIT